MLLFAQSANNLIPVLCDRPVCVLLDPSQEGSNTQISAGPVQLTSQSKTERNHTNLSGAPVSLDNTQWATAVTLARSTISAISANVIVRDDGGETGAAGQVRDNRQTCVTQELG